MSRLIVKGLPKRYDEAQLRELFSFAGEVTDAKVIRGKDGRSRQFGFVGFRNEAEANAARVKVDRTYVNASRVFVQVAKPVGDTAIPRPWSKYSQGSSAYEKRQEKEVGSENPLGRREGKVGKHSKTGKEAATNSNDIADKDVDAYNDFRDAIAKRAKKPIWADGPVAKKTTTLVESRKAGGEGIMLERSHVVFESDNDDDDLYEQLPAAAVETPKDALDEEELTTNPIAHDEGISDAEYFKSKVTRLSDEPIGDSEQGDKSSHKSDDGAQPKEEEIGSTNGTQDADGVESHAVSRKSDDGSNADRGAEATSGDGADDEELPKSVGVDAAETGRLFLRNLSYNVEEEDVERLCEKFGTLADVHIVADPETKRSRGVALVSFVIPENAAQALAALDGTIFCGRILHVLPGRPRPQPMNNNKAHDSRNEAPGMNTFKKGREDARREAARSGNDEGARNAMYLSADAVAGTVAERYGVSKADLLGTERGESGAAAVRLAVGEAAMQAETREYLLQNGIDLSKALKATAPTNAHTTAGRHKRLFRTAFLVKNLPSRTRESDLEDLFGMYGSLHRLTVVPSGLLAVIEFSSAADARRAYGGLAYKRFKDVPLYLEWLPSDALVDPVKGSRSSTGNEVGHSRSKVSEGDGDGGLALQDEQQIKSTTVYVKNLNFETREDALKAHVTKIFKRHSEVAKAVRSVTVATKKNPKDPNGSRLSMGFGFIEFSSSKAAAEAVKVGQSSTLDGHTLELRFSTRGGDRPEASAKRNRRDGESAVKRKPCSKLIVRNIAFEATVKDVRQLFASFGQIKSVRLPRKMDGSHRGFGFLEFVSKNEARTAKTALADAHLYGRHLVIEYADEDTDASTSLAKLQEIAAKQMPESKRRRVDTEEAKRTEDDDAAADEEVRDALYE